MYPGRKKKRQVGVEEEDGERVTPSEKKALLRDVDTLKPLVKFWIEHQGFLLEHLELLYQKHSYSNLFCSGVRKELILDTLLDGRKPGEDLKVIVKKRLRQTTLLDYVAFILWYTALWYQYAPRNYVLLQENFKTHPNSKVLVIINVQSNEEEWPSQEQQRMKQPCINAPLNPKHFSYPFFSDIQDEEVEVTLDASRVVKLHRWRDDSKVVYFFSTAENESNCVLRNVPYHAAMISVQFVIQ